jgi:hypothetical protein
MDTTAKFLALCQQPEITAPEIALALQLSRQRVHQLCKRHGVKLAKAQRGRPSGETKTPYRWGGDRKIASTWVGAAGELQASAELIKMGFLVYRSEARSGPFDLVAYDGKNCHRIEVRSIRKTGQKSPVRWAHVDYLALVLPDGTVEWQPNVPVVP